MFNRLKNTVKFNAKNITGWRTNRKIVVFAVDDYGNVRLDSKEARENMKKAGFEARNRFDEYDALETKQDLEALYEVLASVHDKNNNPAVFTPFAIPCNINFEKIAEAGYREYHYELLTDTFRKQAARYPRAYEGARELLLEGIERKLMIPQFHGREHLNLKVFQEKMDAGEQDVMTVLKNRSYAGISVNGYETISPMAAFDFWEFEENDQFSAIIKDGLNAFEKVFGFRSNHFNPPAGQIHPVLYKTLQENGIKYIDTPLFKKEHQGKGKYKRRFNYTGKKNDLGQIFIVRNVVFEPTEDRNVDWVSFAIKQIEAAFRWNRPAIISSHRVNFCGHIDEKNRERGLNALKELLDRITERWPDVEFVAANELGALIESE